MIRRVLWAWAWIFMSNEFGIMVKFGLGVELWGFGVLNTFFVYTWWFWKELFNFASMIAHRSAPGSPSKASELDFIILKNSTIGREGGGGTIVALLLETGSHAKLSNTIVSLINQGQSNQGRGCWSSDCECLVGRLAVGCKTLSWQSSMRGLANVDCTAGSSCCI